MSLKSLLQSWLGVAEQKLENSVTDPRNEIPKSFFASKRLWVIMAFVAVAWYALGGVFAGDNFHTIAVVVGIYIICETLSAVTTTVGNVIIKVHEGKNDVAYEALEKQVVTDTESLKQQAARDGLTKTP